MAHANSRRQRLLRSDTMPRSRRYWLDAAHRAERREGREIARLRDDEGVTPWRARKGADPWGWD